jgi:hypothetical protein
LYSFEFLSLFNAWEFVQIKNFHHFHPLYYFEIEDGHQPREGGGAVNRHMLGTGEEGAISQHMLSCEDEAACATYLKNLGHHSCPCQRPRPGPRPRPRLPPVATFFLRIVPKKILQDFLCLFMFLDVKFNVLVK